MDLVLTLAVLTEKLMRIARSSRENFPWKAVETQFLTPIQNKDILVDAYHNTPAAA